MDTTLPDEVIDPVCGRTLSTDVPRASLFFRGRRWHFCAPTPERDCRMAFKRDPERWADARPDAGVEVVAPGPEPAKRSSVFVVRSGAVPEGDG